LNPWYAIAGRVDPHRRPGPGRPPRRRA